MSLNPNPLENPIQQGLHQQQPPYAGWDNSYYPQQQYVSQQQQQTYQPPQQNDLLGNISLNSASPQSSLQTQPESQQPKTNKKFVLTKTKNYITDNLVEKKLEEKIQKKKQEEEQKQKEQRPYTKSELPEKLNEINDFSVYFLSQEWVRLQERQNCGHNQIFVKAQQPRKDEKSNTQSYKSCNQRDSQRPPQYQPQIQPFNKETNIQQVADQPEKKQPSSIFHRVSEDIATKLKMDQMKVQPEAFIQQLNQTPEEKEKITREIKSRLNQLAHENFDSISQIIQKLIVENTTQNELTYLKFLAKRIVEKSQTEPKYRKLYTKLCQNLASEPTLPTVTKLKKQFSIFQKELLNQVQNVFMGRNSTKQEDLSHLKSDEKEYYHLIRKFKIIGNIRFIGDLFSVKLLPFLAIEYVIQQLISEYLQQYTPTGENSEESIEGFIELIDQIGPKYKVILGPTDQDTIKDLENHFNGQERNWADTYNCFQKFQKKLSLDIVQKIFELLKTNYVLTQRIQMLIENLLDHKLQGWKDHYNRQDQEQSVKMIQQKQENEIIEQNYTKSKAKGRKLGPQKVMCVEKYFSLSSQQYKKQQPPAFDLNEIRIFVNGTFNMDAQVQNDKLREELKRISSSGEAVQNFFEKFFECMLDIKYVKRSTARASMVFELLMMKEAGESHAKKALQKALNEDKLYDLADSPAAKQLFVDIISFFINEYDLETLSKFYVKPLNEVEYFSAFMVNVFELLIEKYPDEGKLNILTQYFGTFLGYEI